MARNRVIRARGGARRTSQWFAGGNAGVTVGSGSKVVISSLNVTALALRPFTVIRSQLLIHYASDQAAASETPVGAFGAIVVNDQATAIGVTAIPGPITNPDALFLIYQGLISQFDFADATGFNEPAGSYYNVDSKAMRKVEANDDLIFIVENRAAVGAVITIEGRILVKLY